MCVRLGEDGEVPEAPLDALEQLGLQRQDWLSEAETLLWSDARVAAVWMGGSEGRGDADALSDFDLFVALDDRSGDELGGVEDWLARFGTLVWTRETPQNAPAGGRYLRATYEAEVLCLFVDWYFQPASSAVLGADVKILFDRLGLPRDEARTSDDIVAEARRSRPRAAPLPRTRQLEQSLGLFWLMVPIIAKYAARRWDESALSTLDWLAPTVETLCEQEPTATPAGADTGDPLRRLSELASTIEASHEHLCQRGIAIPPYHHAQEWPPFAAALRRVGWRTPAPPKQQP